MHITNTLPQSFSSNNNSNTKLLSRTTNNRINFAAITEPIINLDYSNAELEKTYNTVVQGIKKYFQENGFKKAIVGLSGRIDSSITAVLLADALGPENVVGLYMPAKSTPSQNETDAKAVADNLGIGLCKIPTSKVSDIISEELNEAFSQISKLWGNQRRKITQDEAGISITRTNDTLQERIRANFLWSISNEFPGVLPVDTFNKSELYVGCPSVNGEMTGAFAPIGDITKTKLFALADWMNKNRADKNVIPKTILTKKHEFVPARSQALWDEAIQRIEKLGQNKEAMMKSDFIAHMTESKKSKWLDIFFEDVKEYGIFKWKVAPTIVRVETELNNNSPYNAFINGNVNRDAKIDQALNKII